MGNTANSPVIGISFIKPFLEDTDILPKDWRVTGITLTVNAMEVVVMTVRGEVWETRSHAGGKKIMKLAKRVRQFVLTPRSQKDMGIRVETQGLVNDGTVADLIYPEGTKIVGPYIHSKYGPQLMTIVPDPTPPGTPVTLTYVMATPGQEFEDGTFEGCIIEDECGNPRILIMLSEEPIGT